MSLLKIDSIHTYYGKIHALKGVSLTVEEGEIVTLIGGNGAGKTTTLNTISSIIHASEGQVLLDGEDITHEPPHRVVEKGVVQSPEGRKVFTRLTVRENLELGAFVRSDSAEIRRDMDAVFDRFPRLREREHQLEIGRAHV